MIINCIFILLFFFIVAALAAFYKIKKMTNSDAKNAILKKYYWYLCIVAGVCAIIISDIVFMKIAFIVGIILKGFFEIWNLNLKSSQRWWILTIYSCIGFLSGFYFIWFNKEIILPIYTFVVIFDGMSQIGGQLFGKHKLMPLTSPNKTWEGLGIGFFSAMMAIIFVIHFQASEVFSILHFVGFALFALMGDLMASKIKRMAKVKDFDSLIPGHGGVLDRFDSFLAALIYLIGVLLFFKLELCLD